MYVYSYFAYMHVHMHYYSDIITCITMQFYIH